MQTRTDSDRNRKTFWLATSILAGGVVASSAITQWLGSSFGFDPALGDPIALGLYNPFDWLMWQWEPWAEYYRHFFRSIDSMAMLAGLGITAATVRLADIRRPKKHNDIHGSARFQTDDEVMDSGLVGQDEGVYLAAYRYRGRTYYLRHEGAEHIAVIAPTRSGKGVGPVMMTLLSHTESAVIYDEKGELWDMTAGWRQQSGSKVIRFEPGNPYASAGFNFLSEIRVGTPYEIKDTQNLAVMLIDPDGKGFKDHWDRTGYQLLAGVILHVIYAARAKGEVACLADVADILSNPDITPEKLYNEMKNNKHLPGKKRHKFIAQMGAKQANREERERGAVLSTSGTYLDLFADPIVSQNTRHSDFKIKDLMNADAPVSLYVMVPGSDKVRLKPLTRLLYTQIIRGLSDDRIDFTETVEPVGRFAKWMSWLATPIPRRSRRPKYPHKHKMLLMMDEFPSLGRMLVFQDALAKIAGFGMKAMIFMQDREQLLAEYHHETIISNTHIRLVYAPNKYETAKWISDELDDTTVSLDVYSESGRRGGAMSQVSHSTANSGRKLRTPGEIMKMPGPQKEGERIVAPGKAIVMISGQNPIEADQLLYFEDEVFAERALVPPPSVTDSLAAPAFSLAGTP